MLLYTENHNQKNTWKRKRAPDMMISIKRRYKTSFIIWPFKSIRIHCMQAEIGAVIISRIHFDFKLYRSMKACALLQLFIWFLLKLSMQHYVGADVNEEYTVWNTTFQIITSYSRNIPVKKKNCLKPTKLKIKNRKVTYKDKHSDDGKLEF